jgi:hypothetical protein
MSQQPAFIIRLMLQVLDKAFFLGLLKAHRAEVSAATRELEEDVAGADQQLAVHPTPAGLQCYGGALLLHTHVV